MTTPTGIDRDAPVIAHHEIDIAAALDTVWNLHTDVDAWPAWNPEVTAAELDGAFAPGNSFTWTSHDFTVTSTIYIERYSKVFDNRMIAGRRVATIDNGSPEIIESSVQGILAPRRTVALLSYYRINAVTDAGTRLPSLRSAG